MRWSLKEDLEEELYSFSDPYSQVNVVLNDAKVTINKTYFLLMTNFIRDTLLGNEVTKIIIPHMTKKSFESLVELMTTGEVNFETKEEQNKFLDDIEALEFDESKFCKTFTDAQPSKKPNDNEKSSKSWHDKSNMKNYKNIDRFKVTEEYACKFCLSLLRSRSVRKIHEARCDKNPNYKGPEFKCSKCDKFFKTQVGLKTHTVANHQSIQVHKCGSCEREFKYEQSLKRHCITKKHVFLNSKKPQLNNESEDKTWCKVCFKYIKTLYFETHEKYHRTTFSCKECEFSCNRKDSLHRHYKLVHRSHKLDIPALDVAVNDSVKYTCNKCKEEFEGEDEIREHVILRNCRKLKCCFCGKQFTLFSNMQRHIKKFHK